jgi:beta-N-acetylhexosaminidase
VILFGRNWKDRAQVSALCADIKAVRPTLLICVDHEGGRVQRFRTDGFTHLPPMRALGELWMRDALRASNAATACGYVLGAELRACGVDFSFTPVLDLDWGGSGVIGDRAFHADARRDPAGQEPHARAAGGRRGQLRQALPGARLCESRLAHRHSGGPAQPQAILADDAAPYGWLSTVLTSVMPAHVVYPKVDARPAGFSSRWLNGILRGQLGFGGAIFSDDLSMAGARMIDGREVSYTEAGVAALNAGCDMVLLCNQSLDGGEAVDELLDGLAEAQLKGRWQALEASNERRLALLPRTPAADWGALMTSPRYLHALDLLP